MKKIAALAMFCIFGSGAYAQNVDSAFIQAHITKLTNAKQYTLQAARLMPDSLYNFSPAKDEMSFGKQLVHIAQNLCWLSSAYLNHNNNPLSEADTKATSKQQVENTVAKAYDFAIHELQTFDLHTLSDTVHFFAGPLSKLQIINLIEDHQTHHRGQLLVYLRINGIKPPDYIGW